MDEDALERARQRIDEARAGRDGAVRLEAALERSRAQVEALAGAAATLEAELPDRLARALDDGFRRQVAPVGRNLAEIRGLLNQVLHRLERLEQELLAERHARIDDLALLVDLVSSGWKGVDRRLSRLEQSGAPVIPLRMDTAAEPPASGDAAAAAG
jgi:HPt (histidine-containing phosphotransfer) domain-containing protein